MSKKEIGLTITGLACLCMLAAVSQPAMACWGDWTGVPTIRSCAAHGDLALLAMSTATATPTTPTI